MDLIKTAAGIFLNKLGTSAGGLDPDMVASALSSLLGSGDGELNLSDLISKFSNSGLASVAMSWLGDGSNEGIDVSQILSVLGESNVQSFASQLGLQKPDAANALSDMIPELIDQNSSAGSLMESVGGVSGIAGLASKFFN
jgi:uncharacterized protein YidB (DUF937 family)